MPGPRDSPIHVAFLGTVAGCADLLDVNRDKEVPRFRMAGQKQALCLVKAADRVLLSQNDVRDADAGAFGQARSGVSGDHVG